MSITSIFETGFELGDTRDELTASVVNAVTTSNPKTGTYAFNYAAASGTGNYHEHSGAIIQCRIALHIRHAVTSAKRDLIAVYNGVTACVRVQWDATSSEWVILCGATEVARVGDVAFATTNTYYHIGIDIKIDAVNGWVYVWRDGVEVVSFDGDTNNGHSSFNRLQFGNLSLGVGWTSSFLDDVVWFDSTGEVAPAPVADYRLYALEPNGNGNYNEWDGSDGNAVDNYLLVDEIPANDDTDYLETATADDTESFTMTTFTIPAGFSVEEVIPVAIARKVDALGALGLKLGTRLGGTDLKSTHKALGTSYTLYRERQPTKPGGGVWTQSDLDNLEMLIEAAA